MNQNKKIGNLQGRTNSPLEFWTDLENFYKKTNQTTLHWIETFMEIRKSTALNPEVLGKNIYRHQSYGSKYKINI